MGQLACIIIGPEVHKEEARLLGKHVTVYCRHLYSAFAQRLDDGIYLICREHKIAGDSRLAATGRLEVDRGGDTHRTGRRERHLLFLDGLATGHSKLIHPAILLTFHPDDLVKLPAIELHRRRSSGRRRLQRSFAFGQRSAKGGRQLDWITVSANVHIEGRRLGSKQVVVYRGYFDAAFDQFRHHWIDLGLQ